MANWELKMISLISMRTNKTSCCKLISGFTLIELFLVVIIIGISIATIMPQLSGSAHGWQGRGTSKNMLAAIRLTQQLAVTRQEIMAFVLDTKSDSFFIKSLNQYRNPGDKSDDFPIPKQFLNKDVKITQLEGFRQIGNDKGLVFWPDGTTQKAHLTLTAERSGEVTEWHISVEDDGSAALQEVFKNE